MLGFELAIIPTILLHTYDFVCRATLDNIRPDIDIVYETAPARIITNKTEAQINSLISKKGLNAPSDNIYIYDTDLSFNTNMSFKTTEQQRKLCGYITHIKVTVTHSANTYIPEKYDQFSCEHKIATKITKEIDRHTAAHLRGLSKPIRKEIKAFLEHRTKFGPFTPQTQQKAVRNHRMLLETRYIGDATRIAHYKHHTLSDKHQFRSRLESCKKNQASQLNQYERN